MATVLPQDTPIRRASIADMSIDQVLALVEQMQERRMRQHTLYEAAMAAKAKIKEAKDAERFTAPVLVWLRRNLRRSTLTWRV